MLLPRRRFLQSSLATSAALAAQPLLAQIPGDRPASADGVDVLNPRGRVPVSLIIDDSTCLVNLAHFCIPQFAEVFPTQYKQDWRKLPREIPDDFVRKFAEWSHHHGVKGKYSIVPYPACVGWVDKEMPGWSRKQLEESLQLVRESIMPDWDIHPEMVTHTWVIDTKTGRPYPERTEKFMENWRWTDGKSVDQLTDYLSYALSILKNAGLPCEGVTTPGGFGNRVLPQLSQATFEACRSVFKTEIPHYFRHLYTDDRSVKPRVEYASGLETDDPRCVVSIIGCTGDWFGGWDGLERGSVDQFITADLLGGRLPQVIAMEEPAIMVCHWPGIYFNGEEVGFNIFKEIVKRLNQRYDNLIWMKLSEIARYWAAKELTSIKRLGDQVVLTAPFATENFTLRLKASGNKAPIVHSGGDRLELEEKKEAGKLTENSWVRSGDLVTVCFSLKKGLTRLVVS